MSTFSDNVQKLRALRGLSQRQLAEKLQVSKSTVGNWESSNSMPDFEGLGDVAQALGVSVQDLFEENLDTDTLVPFIEIPVFGRIAAGKPLEMDDADFGFPAPFQIAKSHPSAFFLEVEGESMNRKLPNGCFALVDPERRDPVLDNRAYAICVNGYDATIKRVKRLNNGFQLTPDSTDPTFKPAVYDYGVEGTDTISIIGEVVWYTVPFDFEI